jgi:hypothetical protein
VSSSIGPTQSRDLSVIDGFMVAKIHVSNALDGAYSSGLDHVTCYIRARRPSWPSELRCRAGHIMRECMHTLQTRSARNRPQQNAHLPGKTVRPFTTIRPSVCLETAYARFCRRPICARALQIVGTRNVAPCDVTEGIAVGLRSRSIVSGQREPYAVLTMSEVAPPSGSGAKPERKSFRRRTINCL